MKSAADEVGAGVGAVVPGVTRAAVGPAYTCGGLWLADSKYVAKGFSLRVGFVADWLAVRGAVTRQHPWALPVLAAADAR